MKKLIFLLLTTSIAFAQVGDDPQAGKEKAKACVACHGAEGVSAVGAWPSLAGQSEKYLLKQLRAFKSGDRQQPVMAAQVVQLSDQDMVDLAAYYSQLKKPEGAVAKKWVELGEQVYRAGVAESKVPACMACHGPDGRGNDQGGFPSLSGQQAKYVMAQLKAYRSGQRKGVNGIMTSIAARMTDEQIEAVAHYVAGLK